MDAVWYVSTTELPCNRRRELIVHHYTSATFTGTYLHWGLLPGELGAEAAR